MTSPRSTAPLAGVRVIDFGQYVAGPLAAMLLSDQGADVIKIDPPTGPALPGPEDAVYNRGKKRIVLNLKRNEDVRVARNLLRNADVLIENFRPGVMERLGLGAEAITAENRRLICLSMPGFSSSDSDFRYLPAWEGILGASCGLYTDVNTLREFLGLPPVYSALPHASVYGAVHGALAVVMGLAAREKTGLGDIIEVPLVSAGISAMGATMMNIPNQPPRYDIPGIPRLLRKLVLPIVRATLSRAKPAWQDRFYSWVQTLVPALMSSYRCEDGRLLYVFAIDHARTAVRLLEFLGLKDQLAAQGLLLEDTYGRFHQGRNLGEGSNLSRKWQRELKKVLSVKLRQRPAQEWEVDLNAAGVPCAVQRTTAEWLGLESASKSKITVEVDDPRYGLMRQLGLQAWVDSSPHELANPKPAHRIDQDREEILALASTQRSHAMEPVKRPERAPPLQGLKVLDLCSMIAGPVCARTLAEYGADVIKIVSPRPLHGPRMTCWYGIDVDQGKRSLLLDLKTHAGKSVFLSLVKHADIIVQNLSRDAEKRLGVGYESLKQINPRLICCTVSAFEGPADGPWAGRKGYDPVAQAATGIMMRYGSREHPEHHAIASCVDYLTGYSAAYAVALGVLTRSREPSGLGNAVKSSLAQSAQLIQVPFAFSLADREWTEPHGQGAVGDHLAHRIYRARDGWLFVGARSEEIEKLLSCFGLENSTGHCESENAMKAALERAIRRKTVMEWLRLFQVHGIAAVPIRSLREIRDQVVEDYPKVKFVTHGPTIRVFRQDHPVGCPVETVAPVYARLQHSPIRFLTPAPKPGAHTLEILDELGFTDSEKENLLGNGVVSLALSPNYLPD